MNLGTPIEVVFKTTAYTALLLAVWIMVKPVALPYLNRQIRKYKNYSRLRRLQYKENIDYYRKKFLPYNHLELLLESIWPWYNDSTVPLFVILIAALFAVSAVVFMKLLAVWYLGLLLALITALLPYFVLATGLIWKRNETSHELVPGASILLGKYRVNSRDVYYSLFETVKEMGQYKSLQRALIKLASGIQTHRNKEDLEKAIELFVFQVGTSWAQQLGVLLLTAVWEGKNIEHSLSNIVKDMGRAQEIMEQQKSSNQDTIQMGYFVPVVAFPASLIFLAKITTSGRYLYFQFKTTQGLASFIITLVICVAGLSASLLLRKPKNEI